MSERSERTGGSHGLDTAAVSRAVSDDAAAGRHSRPETDPYEFAREAAEALRDRTLVDRHEIALVLGSGWVPAADALGETQAELSVDELPGFPPPAVEGHAGKLRSVLVGGKSALVFLGRTHLYEGLGVAPVVHGVRTAIAGGARVVVLTNGAGGIRLDFSAGEPVLISDHINLTGRSPIVGARFVDLTDLYAERLRDLCRQVDPALKEGVYVQFPGPQYETPAEVAMARAIGGDLVGMSTTLEAIAAREAGAEVLGMSLVTNLAAGITEAPLDHEEVLQAGNAAAERIGTLLSEVLARL